MESARNRPSDLLEAADLCILNVPKLRPGGFEPPTSGNRSAAPKAVASTYSATGAHLGSGTVSCFEKDKLTVPACFYGPPSRPILSSGHEASPPFNLGFGQ